MKLIFLHLNPDYYVIRLNLMYILLHITFEWWQ